MIARTPQEPAGRRREPQPKDRPLTPRQDTFARLVGTGTPVGQAAVAAGYADPSHGSRVIREPRVAALVEQVRREVAQGLSAQVTGTLAEIVGVIRREIVSNADPDYALGAARALGLAAYTAAEGRAGVGLRAGDADTTDAAIDALLVWVAEHALSDAVSLLRKADHVEAAALVEGHRAAVATEGYGARPYLPAQQRAPQQAADPDSDDAAALAEDSPRYRATA